MELMWDILLSEWICLPQTQVKIILSKVTTLGSGSLGVIRS